MADLDPRERMRQLIATHLLAQPNGMGLTADQADRIADEVVRLLYPRPTDPKEPRR